MIRKLLLSVFFAPALFCVIASAQSADDIVNKHIAAVGGLDKIKAVNTLEMTGKATVGPGLEAPFSMRLTRPGQMRMEITIQGKSLVQATDGTTPWGINPFQGATDPEKLSGEDADDITEQADFDGNLVDYKAKGNTVELMGKEDFEGSEVYKLKVTKKNGDVSYEYLDATSYLELKSTTKRKHDGQEIEVESYPGNYKAVEGVMFPYSIENKIGGQTQFTLTLTSIVVNKPIDGSIYKFPAPAAAAPAAPK
ncbi:MAG TPA: outer membrane lipoprotein-sorting protein [Blastocatellia bacterium]|nr:outer membrane lipoprotein-sorting protein [Blastocatellia bacterium]